jgi:membrane-associated phospholipid phosphatase
MIPVVSARAVLFRTRDWLSVRHSLLAEVIAAVSLYALYEASRGLVVGDMGVALAHARDVVSMERSLHVFVERDVQDAVRELPGMVGSLGVAYLTLHLAVTGGFLLWLHRRRPAAFPIVRTTLFVASALALAGYLFFPTAPPRLAGLGIADTVSGHYVNLNKGLVSSLYNPFAAVPSMHVGYAIIVGAALLRYGKRLSLRLTGMLYPLLVLFIVVATGNHFLFDAAAGAAVAAVATLAAILVLRKQPRACQPRRRLSGSGSIHSCWRSTAPQPAQQPAITAAGCTAGVERASPWRGRAMPCAPDCA